MKVLIIDDSEYKIESLVGLLGELVPTATIGIAKCFQSAIQQLKNVKPDLVLLDMSLPTSERSNGKLDGRMRMYGGRELMEEMDFERIVSKVIVVTQFDHFPDTPKPVTLEVVLKQLSENYPNMYVGGVYYSTIDSNWKNELKKLVSNLKTNWI